MSTLPKSPYRVFKFGGTSMADAKAVHQALAIVSKAPQHLAVVLSAMAGITDLCLKAIDTAMNGQPCESFIATFRERHLTLANELINHKDTREKLHALVHTATDELTAICHSLSILREKTPRIVDLTVSRGERLLARIFCAALQERSIKADYIDATDIIVAKKQHGQIVPDLASSTLNTDQRLKPALDAHTVVVMPGYIAQGPEQALVTLGRGGSDLSATILAHALKAQSVTLYKEVEGLMTADPRHVSEARLVPELHYREAGELAYYGAKILHPRTIIPLLDHHIPLQIKSTFEPDLPGTRIADDVSPGAYPVKALTAILSQSLVSVEGKGMTGVPGVAARLFSALAQAGVSVSMISQASSEASICFVVPDAEAKAVREAIEEAFALEIDHNLIDGVRLISHQAIVAAVGLGMKGTPGIASRVFGALARHEINIEAIAQGSSELNISVVIDEKQVGAALCALHREFRLEKLRALPAIRSSDTGYAIIGTGQIGRSLIRQINAQNRYFREKMELQLTCLGLADRSGVLVDHHGFDANRLDTLIKAKERGEPLLPSSKPLTTAALQEQLRQHLLNLDIHKGVLVDTTAEDTVEVLREAIETGWHIVLANKKPLATQQSLYDEIFSLARDRGRQIRYEATVGAGLPILDTLEKLTAAGDEVRTIAGCFSGTLGFILASIMAGETFSAAVRKAFTSGYTEPDPREDLSGMDVCRKALILARALGHRLNLSDIAVQPLFTPHEDDPNPESFLAKLTALDEPWRERVIKAQKDHKTWRYVARIDQQGVRVGLEAVALSEPLGRLAGTDNQVIVTSKRYDTRPLVVTGPGAGAEVTAAGVLNDLLAIATANDRSLQRRKRGVG